SSPADDGTGDPNDSLFTGWSTLSNGTLFTNASDWLAQPSQWNLDGAGSWSNNANWLAGAPNGTTAVASFTSAIMAARVVTVDAPQKVGTINFDNANSYTLSPASGTGTITIDGGAFGAGINVISGNHTIAAPVVLSKNTTINVATSSTLTMSGDVISDPAQPAGTILTKAGGGKLLMKSLRTGGVSID